MRADLNFLFIQVRLGEHDLSVKDQYEQDIPVKTVKTHPAFGIGAKKVKTGKVALYAEHDIALLELSEPARIDTRTFPVCVDPGLSDFSEGENGNLYECQRSQSKS